MAAVSAGQVLMMFKGAYNPTVKYDVLNVVSHNGGNWVAKKPSEGITPVEGEYWYKWMDPEAKNFISKDEDNQLEEGSDGKLYVGVTEGSGAKMVYGTCNTASDQQIKAVTVADEFKDGDILTIYFANSNTFSATADNPITFKINNVTYSVNLFDDIAVATGTNTSLFGYGGRTISYRVSVTNKSLHFFTKQWDNNNTYTNVGLGQGYATCTTGASTTAKVATLGSYALTVGGVVVCKFTNAVPANATLNVNGKGAKAIYYKDKAIVANVIKAGDTATFIYDGSYYRLISVDSATVDNIVSDAYSSTKAYTTGEYCIYNNTLYKCINDTTAGVLPTNTTYFKSVKVGTEFSDLNSKITVIKGANYNGSDGTYRLYSDGYYEQWGTWADGSQIKVPFIDTSYNITASLNFTSAGTATNGCSIYAKNNNYFTVVGASGSTGMYHCCGYIR